MPADDEFDQQKMLMEPLTLGLYIQTILGGGKDSANDLSKLLIKIKKAVESQETHATLEAISPGDRTEVSRHG